MHLRLLSPSLLLGCLLSGASPLCAQGTHLWNESSFSDWERGTPQGIAIGSDGTLSAGLPVEQVAQLNAADVWAAASDAAGNAYVATGSPAQVVRVAPDGKQTVLFTAKDVSVQALTAAPDGTLYAATLPSAKVFRLDPRAGKPLDETTAPVVFDAALTSEKPKYVWAMLLDLQGRLLIGAGAPGTVYRTSTVPGSKAEVLFASDEPHIRTLAWARDGSLLAGSDGTGLVYRVDVGAYPARKPYVLFEAPKREITALATGAGGQLYVAAVGEKGRNASLPPLQAGGAGGGGGSITVTVVQPGSTQSVTNNTAVPDGSEVYLLPADAAEAPRRIWAGHDDVVYALHPTPAGLLAATGNRGRIYRLQDDGSYADVAHAEAGQVTGFIAAPGDTLYLPAANAGKLLRMALTPAPDSTLLSEVFDATQLSLWGRAELTGDGAAGTYRLETRTGNIDNPARGWSDWKPIDPATGATGQAPARYVQWRLTLRAAARVQQVTLNYLPANAAPEIDEILVAPGTRVNAGATQASYPQQTTLSFASQGGTAVNIDGNSAAAPLGAIRDKTAVTVRWAAHDDNGDELRFAVYYRRPEESTWRLLKDNLTDRYLSFDANLLPDGPYRLRVVATDAPSHAAGQALTGERTSDLFLLATATPQVSGLAMRPGATGLHVTATAIGGRVPIARAEYSLDAGPWQYVEPVGRISDALREQYDFAVPLGANTGAGGHVLTLRAFDRYDNEGSAKVSLP